MRAVASITVATRLDRARAGTGRAGRPTSLGRPQDPNRARLMWRRLVNKIK